MFTNLRNIFSILIVTALVLLVSVRFTGALLPFSLTVVYLTTVGLMVFYKIALTTRNERFVLSAPSQLLIFYGLFILSFITSAKTDYSLEKTTLFFSIALLPFVLGKVDKKQIAVFINIFSYLFSAVVMGLMISSLSGGSITIFTNVSNLGFTLTEQGNTNVVSAYMMMGILCHTYQLYRTSMSYNTLRKAASVGVILVAVILLFLTGSRGAYVSIIVASIMIALARSSHYKLLGFSLIILIIYLTIGGNLTAILFLTPESWHSFIEKQVLDENSTSVESRFLLISMALDNFINNASLQTLLFGNGVGSFAELFGLESVRAYPHNIYIEIMYELGILSLLSFVLLSARYVVSTIGVVQKASNEYVWLYAMFLVLLIRGNSTDDLGGNVFIFFFMHVMSSYKHKETN